jgi:hypothetical protein
MQQHLDPSPAYTFTTTTTTNQPYQYDSNLMHHVDGGSPSHELPRTPVLTPPPPYAVPSPNSLPSPTNQEPPPQPFAPYMMQDIKPPPFLHLKEKNKKQADIEQWEEYTNPSKAYSELYDCNNRLVYVPPHFQFTHPMCATHFCCAHHHSYTHVVLKT